MKRVKSNYYFLKTVHFLVCFLITGLSAGFLYNTIETSFGDKYPEVKIAIQATCGVIFAQFVAKFGRFGQTINDWTRIGEVLVFWSHWLFPMNILMYVIEEIISCVLYSINNTFDFELENLLFIIDFKSAIMAAVSGIYSVLILKMYKYRERNLKRGNRWNYMRKFDI